MAPVTIKPHKYADNAVRFLEVFVTFYCLKRMLENILFDLGYSGLDTEGLAIVLYMVFSTQVCMLLSWTWSTPSSVPGSRTKIYTTLVLGCLLLAEVCLAVCGLALTWTGLLWDVAAAATLQALLSAALYIVYDRQRGKDDHVQPALEFNEVPRLRRRRPGG